MIKKSARFSIAVGFCLLAAACSKDAPTSPTPAQTSTPPQTVAPAPPVAARPPAATYSTTTVSFTSDPGHYVGGGRSLTFTKENARFFPEIWNAGGHLYVEIREVPGPVAWGFHVWTPNNAATVIVPGVYNAARDPLSPAWYFSFFGNAHSCSREDTQLTVHQFDFDRATMKLANFRASFANHCEGGSPGMRGEIAILADWQS